MQVEFISTKVVEDFELPAEFKRKGRPRKKIIEKNVGSLVGKKSLMNDFEILHSFDARFEPYNSYTFEWITEDTILHLENIYPEQIGTCRYILNKESRAIKGLDISGVRTWQVVPFDYGRGVLHLSYIFTNPMACVFLASRLIAKNKFGYTGLTFSIKCREETIKARHTRKFLDKESRFSRECGYWWDCYNYLLGEDEAHYLISAKEGRNNFTLSADNIARALLCIIKSFNPVWISCGNFTIVKGAVGYCQYIKDGKRVNIEGRIIRKSARSYQTFGTFYNHRARRVEHIVEANLPPIWARY